MSANDGRPRVWYVAGGYHRAGGVEAYLCHYATAIRAEGFEPRLVVFDELPAVPHRYLRALRERGVPIESLYRQCRGAAVVWALLKWPLMVLRGRRTPFATLRYYERKKCAVRLLKRKIARERPEIIHVKGRIIYEAFPVFPGRCTVYQHATVGTVDPSWDAHELAAFREFLGRVARILVQAGRIATAFQRDFEVRRTPGIIYTMAPDELAGAPVPERSGQGDTLRFGLLTRLEQEKGIVPLLEALRQYQARHGQVNFTFAGAGGMVSTIRGFAAQHGLSGVRVVSVTTPADTLRDIDVFVHPSLTDAMPVAIVEALMCGLPVIASDVGGCAELVRDGREGWIIAPASSDAILAGMERVAALSPAERAAYSRRARERYETVCRPEVVAAQVAAVYREVMERGRNTEKLKS